jgi:hypothetical protein
VLNISFVLCEAENQKIVELGKLREMSSQLLLIAIILSLHFYDDCDALTSVVAAPVMNEYVI